IERDAFGVLRDAGIAGRGVKPAQQRRGRNLPRQRMLAPARADQEYVHDWSSQFSIFNSPTRENSRPLRVTRMRERDKACPAINTSYGPIGLPADARPARISPAQRASSRSNSTTGNCSA